MFPAAVSFPRIGFQLLIREFNLLYDCLNPGIFIVTSAFLWYCIAPKMLLNINHKECFVYCWVFFTRRYPCALDVAMENRVKNVFSDNEKSLLHQFISLTMSCGKYQVGNHAVYQSLQFYGLFVTSRIESADLYHKINSDRIIGTLMWNWY